METSGKAINEGIAALFDTISEAAEKLGTDPQALRARCRRAARRHGGAATVPLGGGIIAFKFGSSWRLRFPSTLIDRRDARNGGGS